MRHVPVFLLIFIAACGTPPAQNNAPTSQPVTVTEEVYEGYDTLFHQEYKIKLISGFKVEHQKGADFDVYYFTPKDTTVEHGEAGIYFGARPDDSSPSTDYSRKETPGTFMNQPVTWIEYTTSAYTQRETFVEIGPEMKIHCWCYANNSDDLEKLYAMIRTVE